MPRPAQPRSVGPLGPGGGCQERFGAPTGLLLLTGLYGFKGCTGLYGLMWVCRVYGIMWDYMGLYGLMGFMGLYRFIGFMGLCWVYFGFRGCVGPIWAYGFIWIGSGGEV